MLPRRGPSALSQFLRVWSSRCIVSTLSKPPREKGILSSLLLRRRLRSGSAWAFGGRIGGAMVGIVTNALVMRMLPTDPERDAYFLALSIVSLGAVVGSLGLPKTVVRLIAKNMGVYRPERARRVSARC